MSNALKLLLEKTEFSLTDDFSDTQGPIWYYKCGDKDSGKYQNFSRRIHRGGRIIRING